MVKYRDPEQIRQSHEELKNKYSKKKASWAARDEGIFNYIKSHFNQEARILDVGCANGYFTNKLLNNGYHNIDLIDIDNYLVYPEAVALNRLKTADLNIDKLPYEDEGFDLVVAFQVLEHLENPFYFMRECKRVLKPGGTLLLSIPNIFTLKDRLMFFLTGNLYSYNLINDHISLFTKDVFQKCFLNDFEMDKKVFYSPLSKISYRLNIPSPKELFKKFFCAKVCYVLKRKLTDDEDF